MQIKLGANVSNKMLLNAREDDLHRDDYFNEISFLQECTFK